MESLDNSPIWLAFLQILVVIANAVLFSIQRGRSDQEKRDVEGFRTDLGVIRLLAESAKTQAEGVNRELYEAVRAKCEQALLHLVECQATSRKLEESLASLSNKLASRDRADQRQAKAVRDEEEVEQVDQPGGLDAATLARLGAVPLSAQPTAPAPAPRTNFGRVGR